MEELGKHHRFSPSQTTKGRIALVAVATGAVSTAGVCGAAAAQVQNHSDKTETNVGFALANDAATIPGADSSAPQILAISEFKPVADIDQQLGKSVELAQERIEAAEAAAAAGITDLKTLVANAAGAVKPAEGTFTSNFGQRWGVFHKGIDIANAEGTPIRSVLPGTVISSGPASGFGQWVRVQHDDGTITVYGHVSTLLAQVGQRVNAGDIIAGMGSLGFSTGTHLHFEVHPGGGEAIDPVPWLAALGITV
ncbi:M23 family metallopeptidase [Corynebacterium uberis]|uniref:M23 family metallopeptidase n=1 Tax=Corynebacterium uberis TaxID=2883169 RepID=UPI001D0AABEB|nr:M23 family metallopeptidase [Corynebacterium uberis]UDL78626.1 M23 family metallopeptidase [Corynebacterium uberis]